MRRLGNAIAVAALLALGGCYYGDYGYRPTGWNQGWYYGTYGGHRGWYDNGGAWRGWHDRGGWHDERGRGWRDPRWRGGGRWR
ncbi:hypothetical protein AA23498_0597 [Acetobacter nitrogenifigens DSM 23921 = NBRC 105050]|uniref:Lipoprotein n=1 Tax=Acetobacter nitrogenifigens DSM 23921 = NBRC 105050 TaxID=1120919 RepID=A0A511X846_9PROT|nr:hypothetical protein [Acetobacter nitrogenifigens]GBQ89347.1 hypothetical protein AA23498_0597 [Acetobacter nitrogenifigens DSM 23921 = NBRC 105050]GEN59120.1 hypothetical protein ANI02nite_10040 [Acetobacter nitrogenifigens DSM 23921 = NBRC 105050]